MAVQPIQIAGGIKTANQNIAELLPALNGIRVLGVEVDTQAIDPAFAEDEYKFGKENLKHPLGITFPEGAQCIGGFIRVSTGLTSEGAAIPDIGVMSGSSLISLFDNSVGKSVWSESAVFPFSYSSAEGAPNPYIKPVGPTVSGKEVYFTVPTYALTAGKFQVYLFYIPVLVSTDPEPYLE